MTAIGIEAETVRPDPQPEVDRRGAEDEPEERAEHEGAEGQLGEVGLGGHVGLEGGGARAIRPRGNLESRGARERRHSSPNGGRVALTGQALRSLRGTELVL